LTGFSTAAQRSAFDEWTDALREWQREIHLVIGYQGMQRIVAAGRVPVEIHQRYINRMLAICYDAFGAEVSSRAGKIYDWGLYLTDPRFNRHNGPYAGQRWDGPERLPTEEDEATLQEIFKDPAWIAPGAA